MTGTPQPVRPRVLFLNNQGLASIGGGVTILRHLAAAFAIDCDVTVLSHDAPADPAILPEAAGVRQLMVALPVAPGRLWRLAPLLRARHLARTVPDGTLAGADLIIALDCHFELLLRRLPPRRLIYLSLSCIPRQEWFASTGAQRPLRFLQYAVLERRIATAADVVVVSSAMHAAELVRFERLRRLRPALLRPLFPSPAPLSRTRTSESVTILSAGRLEPAKNFLAVIALAQRLRDLPCRFVIAGDGPERAGLQARAVAAGVEGYVSFAGPVTDFNALLAQSDIFLHPSRYESFGMVVFEAMRAGVPPVGGRGRILAGYTEIVHDGIDSCLVDFDQPDMAAAALRRVVTDPALRARMGIAAQETARKLLVNDYVAAFRRVADPLLEGRAA